MSYVRLDHHSQTILGYLIRRNRIRLVLEDRVLIEISDYDSNSNTRIKKTISSRGESHLFRIIVGYVNYKSKKQRSPLIIWIKRTYDQEIICA